VKRDRQNYIHVFRNGTTIHEIVRCVGMCQYITQNSCWEVVKIQVKTTDKNLVCITSL